jgi:hypothetical protein
MSLVLQSFLPFPDSCQGTIAAEEGGTKGHGARLVKSVASHGEEKDQRYRHESGMDVPRSLSRK